MPKTTSYPDKRLIEAVENNTGTVTGATARDVAEELDISRSWARTRLNRLTDAGELRKCAGTGKDGRINPNGYRRVDE